MDNFFRRLQARHNPPDLEAEEKLQEQKKWLLKQYIHFCQSRFASSRMLEEDLEKLLRIPEITDISFAQNDSGLSMLLGTAHVYIVSPTTHLTHDIGEFVVVINKGNKSVRFANVTRTVMRDDDYGLFHPHVPANSGRMCIQSGLTLLEEHIGNGRMYDAVRIIVQALFITNGTPYLPVHNWPLKEE